MARQRGSDGRFVTVDDPCALPDERQPGRRGGANRRPGLYGERSTGWTEDRRKAFLTGLAETSNVQHAVDAVGLSATSAYAKRRREPAFRLEWQAAIEEGYANLELDMVHRARFGKTSTRIERDADRAVVGSVETHDFTDAVSLRLLKSHRDLVARERALARDAADDDDTDEAAKIARLRQLLAARRAAIGGDPAETDA